MVNLKIDDGGSMMLDSDYRPSQYPGGLCLYLDDETCERLGLTGAIKAGTEVGIIARALVTSSTESVDRDNDGPVDVSLSLQITDMSLAAGDVVKGAAQELYGDS